MVWHQVKAEVTKPHVAYAVTGFALVLFGTISLFLKEKIYIGEATVATIYGLIVGPHCLNWFAPTTWGNSDYITIEISRIVLIVQIFAVAVELPKKYMLRHWWSITMLLFPVMTYGWLLSSVFIWKLVPTLRWVEALCISGCITATDPVLAAAVVGKGKFAKRVPGHLRNLLSAESGCNDGMAFPFVIMAIDILNDEKNAAAVAKNFICVGILYSCILGILIGVTIGYLARHLIKFAEKHNLIDRENFLVYYFCVAMFCAGVGTLCGVDDLLVAFGAGAAFSWDGWFAKQTRESHVSEVIDSLLNTAFFIYFGAIVPWPDFNNYALGIRAWKLVCLAILVLVVRRLPIILALKPVIPDIHTWREALFCGHFGPIGVGAVFMALLARAQLESHSETPTATVPKDHPQYYLIATMWPISCFLVISSIIVHGSSIAVFTLGKRINNMAITLTYTTGGNEPSWLQRLPRRSSEAGNILQLQRLETEEPLDRKLFKKKRKGKKTGRGDVVPQEQNPEELLGLKLTVSMEESGRVVQVAHVPAKILEGKELKEIRTFQEGPHIIVEDNNGVVIHKFDIGSGKIQGDPSLEIVAPEDAAPQPEADAVEKADEKDGPSLAELARRGVQRPRSRRLSRSSGRRSRRGQHAYAYQIDDNVVVENNEGDVLRRYRYVRRGSAPHRTFMQKIRHLIPRFNSPTAHGDNDASSSDRSFKDLENAPESMLVPEDDSTADLKPLSPETEERLQRQLTRKLEQGELSTTRTPIDTGLPLGGDAELYLNDVYGTEGMTGDETETRDDTTEYAGESGEEDDDEDEPETEVERHRRMAALGIESNSRRESSFSEGIAENDDEDGADTEDANATRASHSGSEDFSNSTSRRTSVSSQPRASSGSRHAGSARADIAAMQADQPQEIPEIAIEDETDDLPVHDREDGLLGSSHEDALDAASVSTGEPQSPLRRASQASHESRAPIHSTSSASLRDSLGPRETLQPPPPAMRRGSSSRDVPRITFRLPERPREK